jgi:hypothetical protein
MILLMIDHRFDLISDTMFFGFDGILYGYYIIMKSKKKITM